MTGTPYELAAAPTSHNAADPAELNVVCRSKSNLPNQTDSNAALLLYLTHQLGSAHEWSGVWDGPRVPNLSLERQTGRQGLSHYATLERQLIHTAFLSCAEPNE